MNDHKDINMLEKMDIFKRPGQKVKKHEFFRLQSKFVEKFGRKQLIFYIFGKKKEYWQ